MPQLHDVADWPSVIKPIHLTKIFRALDAAAPIVASEVETRAQQPVVGAAAAVEAAEGATPAAVAVVAPAVTPAVEAVAVEVTLEPALEAAAAAEESTPAAVAMEAKRDQAPPPPRAAPPPAAERGPLAPVDANAGKPCAPPKARPAAPSPHTTNRPTTQLCKSPHIGTMLAQVHQRLRLTKELTAAFYEREARYHVIRSI